MKSIGISEKLHKWIMDHKDCEKSSAEKVIFYLINRVSELENELEKYGNKKK